MSVTIVAMGNAPSGYKTKIMNIEILYRLNLRFQDKNLVWKHEYFFANEAKWMLRNLKKMAWSSAVRPMKGTYSVEQ